jgi:hypothetical protein
MLTRRLLAGAVLLCSVAHAWPETPNLGRPVAPDDVAPWDISIGPDGVGLPPGSGTVARKAGRSLLRTAKAAMAKRAGAIHSIDWWVVRGPWRARPCL